MEIASVGLDNSIRFWDPESGGQKRLFRMETGWSSSLDYSNDGKWFCASNHEETLLFERDGNRPPIRVQGSSACFSPDNLRLAVTRSGTTKILNVENLEEELTINSSGSFLRFNPHGDQIALAHGNVVLIWDALTGDHIRTLRGHSDIVTDLAFSSAGEKIVTSSRDHTSKIWDLREQSSTAEFDCLMETVG